MGLCSTQGSTSTSPPAGGEQRSRVLEQRLPREHQREDCPEAELVGGGFGAAERRDHLGCRIDQALVRDAADCDRGIARDLLGEDRTR